MHASESLSEPGGSLALPMRVVCASLTLSLASHSVFRRRPNGLPLTAAAANGGHRRSGRLPGVTRGRSHAADSDRPGRAEARVQVRLVRAHSESPLCYARSI